MKTVEVASPRGIGSSVRKGKKGNFMSLWVICDSLAMIIRPLNHLVYILQLSNIIYYSMEI